ncbi:MAG: hypothetical protein IJX34_01020 [Clostridia bacterium]|nr:hypothetical protein [Clostridia bacterium]
MKRYINLRDVKIEFRSDLLENCHRFRNQKFENYRIIYMRDNKMIGFETIVSNDSKTINNLIANHKFPYLVNDNLCEDISRRMYNLGANGYYIQKNSTKAKLYFEDRKIANIISRKIKGFRGYIIVTIGKYAWIDKNERVEEKRIESLPVLDNNSYILQNPLMQNRINSKNDLARYIYDINNSSHYLNLILTSKEKTIKLFQELPITFINMSYRSIYEYIKNKCIETDSIRAYITTTDKYVFERAKELVEFGYLTDSIAYTITNGKAKMVDSANLEWVEQDLFRVEANKRKRNL